MSAPTSYTYQWKSAGSNATGPGATTATYTVVAADAGNTITCVVTGTNAAGSGNATTAATSAVGVASSARFVGFTCDTTNRNGMQGKNITAGNTPRTNFPGGGSPQENVAVGGSTFCESFTDYLSVHPWPPIIGCFMNSGSSGGGNAAAFYFSGTNGGYPNYLGQLTNPTALTGGPFLNAPYLNPDGTTAIPAIPIISWDLGSTSLTDIAAGVYDTSTIIPAALKCKAWPASNPGNPAYGSQPGGQVIIRFCHEMNGTWSGYNPHTQGKTSAQFVAMWQHVVQVFAAQGATNARWHWCPNQYNPGAADAGNDSATRSSAGLQQLYPGDNYVDYVGIDGYNRSSADGGNNWVTFLNTFQYSYNTMYSGDSFTSGPICGSTKPMILGEIGCWETDSTSGAGAGQSKAQWFLDMLTVIPADMPNIIGVCYWDEIPNNYLEYFLDSSPAATAGWETVANTWTGRPAVIPGVTSLH